MANYFYVQLPQPVTPQDLETALKDAVQQWPLTVSRPEFEPEYGCSDVWAAVYKGDGFTVQRSKRGDSIVFRSVALMGLFWYWVQNVVADRLASHFGAQIHYDATGETVAPGRFDAYPTFRSYLARNYELPLTPETEAFHQRYLDEVPEGFEGPF